jgi:hypothetical protein
LFMLGCGNASLSDLGAPGSESSAASAWDPATAGIITGQVVWRGEIPTVARLPAWGDPSLTGLLGPRRWEDSPNAPAIHPQTRGVAGAVVFLREIDARRGRPWDHPPVCVQLHDYQLRVHQGETVGRVGFMHRGETLEMTAAGPVFHALHGNGADFFALVLPHPGDRASRRVQEKGLVELTSGAGYYWMRGYVFVDDHPYYTRTDAEGRFTLPQVPPGNCEVACWLPDWREASHERDPESGLVTRLTFRPPLEVVRPIQLAEGESQRVDFAIAAPP